MHCRDQHEEIKNYKTNIKIAHKRIEFTDATNMYNDNNKHYKNNSNIKLTNCNTCVK